MNAKAAPMSPEECAQKIETITKRLVNNLQDAMAVYSMHIGINDNAEFREIFKETYEANGLNTVNNALLWQSVIVLARCFDHADPLKSQNTNRASIPHVIGLLDDKNTILVHIDNARKWTPDIPGFADNHARAALRAIQLARVRYKRLVNSANGKVWLETVKEFRNRFLAHSLFDMNEAEALKHGYIGDLLKATCGILKPLRLGVSGTNWEPMDFLTERDRQSEAFLNALGRGVKLVHEEYDSILIDSS